jgi:hypothetical protein
MATWLPRRNKISRRAMLRGMLGGTAIAVGLPALEMFLNDSGTAYADCGNGMPTVFGTFYFGNGVLPDRWNPTRSGTGYDLPPLLSRFVANDDPMTPGGGDHWDITQDVSVVSGTRVLTTNTSPHGSGPAGLFSGADLVDDTFVGPSLDQVVADALGMETPRPFNSLEIGVQRSTSSWSMTGPHAVNPPDCDPLSVYTRVFTGGFRLPGDMSAPPPEFMLRQSVLSAVRDQTTRLQSRVGAADRMRLEQHMDGIRSLESRLMALQNAPVAPACTAVPPSPMTDYPDMDGRPQMKAVHRAMADLLTVALACDQTRVFFEMYSQPVNNTLFLDTTSGHHQLTHDEPDPQSQVEEIVTFIIGEFAYLVNNLANVQEGSQRLLDRCAILGTTDVSYGRTHSLDDYPILIAGNACGRLKKPGIHYASPGESASKVPLTLLGAVGVTATEYGRGAARTTDVISELLA